jgi:putative endonuclease
MIDKKAIGNRGEALALKYLSEKGYTLLVKNYRCKRAEIDLIVRNEETLVFVEVKARSSTGYGFPEEAVDEKKAAMIMEAADQYIYESAWEGAIRFDVISIVLQPQISIRHFEDAFW